MGIQQERVEGSEAVEEGVVVRDGNDDRWCVSYGKAYCSRV
jgi:hypothetical protein